MSEIPTPFKILSAITAGTLVGCSVAEAISPIPTEQAKNIIGTFELASAEIGDNFWNTQVIYGNLNPLDKEGLTKQDLTCLNIETNKSNFNFCTFESRDGAKENWWIKSPEGWLELQKIVKSGYNMDGETIDVATWVLGNENVIWYPQNQDDWLKDSQNPNFGITFLPPSVFGENPIQGYDRSSGLGIKIPLVQVENDPLSQENIFQAIAYRTGFQIGGVTPTLVQPTETPSPESLLPPEVKEKFELAGIDLTNMENAKYDKDGLHITLASGEVIVLTNTDLQKGIYNGQDNVLQYRDEANENVLYAFDPENKTFLEASKYIQPDRSAYETGLVVNTFDELEAIWQKEKLFLIPFDPNNTYFPPSDKIYRDYDDGDNKFVNSGEFREGTPFGNLPDGMDSPFRFVSYVKILNNTEQEDGPDGYIISEQVYNPATKNFSVMHFYSHVYQLVEETQEQGMILLPQLFPRGVSSTLFKPLMTYYKERGLSSDNVNHVTPLLKRLVDKWFDEGSVPSELESAPWMITRTFLY